MRKIKNPFLHKPGYDCFGCSPDNPIGLRMEFYEDGDDVVSFWRPVEHCQGWVGVMHGGIIATLIDETAGWLVMRKLQTSGVTSRLSVRYQKPVSSAAQEVVIRSKITGQKRNYVSIGVSVENGDGETCASAEVVYYVFGQEKAREMGFCGCEAEDEQLLPM